MSQVICDTSKVRISWLNSMGIWQACILGLRNKNNEYVKFAVARDKSLTLDEVYTLFFEKLEKREFKTNRRTGSGTLCQTAEGNYYLEYGKADVGPSGGECGGNSAKPVKAEPKKVTGLGDTVFFDPHDPKSREMIGRRVIGSTTYVFSEGSCVVGTLTSVNGMFHIQTEEGLVSCPFIKERRPEPLDLNKVGVRRSLLGKILISKDKNTELLVTTITKVGTSWKVNGMSAYQMMNGFTFEDGTEMVSA